MLFNIKKVRNKVVKCVEDRIEQNRNIYSDSKQLQIVIIYS